MIQAPWTKEQVKILKQYQKSGLFHPHTCTCKGSPVMSVTKNGLICKKCNKTQTWVSEVVFEMIRYNDITQKWVDAMRNLEGKQYETD